MEGELQVQQILNPHRLRSLQEWVQKNSITLTQINGQRKYGGPPPGWQGPAPGPGCEVFISQIPRDVYEDRLIPLFQTVGTIYEFRLMMNFSGQNRGFAYAQYGDPQTASTAVSMLHQYRLREEGVCITVRRSTEKRQLKLTDLPANLSQAGLLIALRFISEGVEDVQLKPAGTRSEEMVATVNYSSHYAASMAKKVLVQGFKKRYNHSVTVRWASFSKSKREEDTIQEDDYDDDCFSPPLLKPQPKTLLSLNFVSSTPQLKPVFRAVGGPSEEPREGIVTPLPANPDTVSRLQWMCEINRLGSPQYEVYFHHTAPDGFLYFVFKVEIPGVPLPFYGFVQILPGTSSRATKGEVYRAAAEQVIQTLHRVSNLRHI
ncbi:hypothetical protein DNTS_031588 [Danionella cerebrum]|uniref:RRM domain-containing protein n=1 Tax=Danionella cerebrum TaxID=2873325 RepID=A0A553QJI4_9TELE|nr:hypothetical protein DNTS_031588 [Danionella translucida]